MSEEQKEEVVTKKLVTLSLAATQEEIDKLWEEIAKAGWKLKYRGHSGSWLGEPVYEVKAPKE